MPDKILDSIHEGIDCLPELGKDQGVFVQSIGHGDIIDGGCTDYSCSMHVALCPAPEKA